MNHNHRSEIVFAFTIAVLLCAAYLARSPLVLIYVSVLFAAMISPIVDRIHCVQIAGWHPTRGLVILLIALLGLALAALLGLLVLPRVSRDLQQLSSELPQDLSGLLNWARQYPVLRQIDPSTLQQHAAELFRKTVQLFPAIASAAFWGCLHFSF